MPVTASSPLPIASSNLFQQHSWVLTTHLNYSQGLFHSFPFPAPCSTTLPFLLSLPYIQCCLESSQLQKLKQQRKQSDTSSFLQTVSLQIGIQQALELKTNKQLSHAVSSAGHSSAVLLNSPGLLPSVLALWFQVQHQLILDTKWCALHSRASETAAPAPMRGRHKPLHWALVPKEKFSSVTITQFSWKISPDSQNSQVQLSSIYMTWWYVITLKRWVDNWVVTGSDCVLPKICLYLKVQI